MTILKWPLLAILLLSNMAFAENSGRIKYDGQSNDQLELDTIRVETRYRSEEQDTTCTRQIPYTERVCRMETRYRRECHWEPSRNVCRTVNHRVCRTVRRTRRQCRTTPGREVCHTTPSRRTCRTGRDGRRICRNIPGRRVCRTAPGRTICNDVPYDERVCQNVPRRECHTVPGRNVCRQIPYQENVCRDVTRYRTETYPCRRTVQVPYQFKKRILGDINVDFIDHNGPLSKANLDFILEESGHIGLNIKDKSSNPALIFISKSVSQEDSDAELKVMANYDVDLYSQEKVLAPIKEEFASPELTKEFFRVNLGKVHQRTEVEVSLKIVRKRSTFKDKTLIDRILKKSEYNIANHGDFSMFDVNLENLDVKIKDKRDHRVYFQIRLKVNKSVVNLPSRDLTKKEKFKL